MGLFFAFEGPDGSGKSTQARLLAATLRDRGQRVVETREPGGTTVGEAVRHVLLDVGGPAMSARTMALLLSASRAQLVDDVIQPALRDGAIVLVDRYTDSTIAYQGYGLGLDRSMLDRLSGIATLGLRPRLSIYVDVPVEVGLERVGRRNSPNRLDVLDLAFHERVRAGYLATIAEDPSRWLVVDGQGTPDEVHSFIRMHVSPLLEEVMQPS